MVMAKDTQIVSARTTPSAGVLSPFEILVFYREGVKASFYIYDADRGAFRDYSSAHVPTWEDLAATFRHGPGHRIGGGRREFGGCCEQDEIVGSGKGVPEGKAKASQEE